MYICVHCHGYTMACATGSDTAKELHACNCEPCAKCQKVIDRDDGNYLDGRHEPYCNKCYPQVEADYVCCS
jgi:hypothetical protein